MGYKVKKVPIRRVSVRGWNKNMKKKSDESVSFMDGSILGSLVGAKTESILLPHSTPTQGCSK